MFVKGPSPPSFLLSLSPSVSLSAVSYWGAVTQTIRGLKSQTSCEQRTTEKDRDVYIRYTRGGIMLKQLKLLSSKIYFLQYD